VGGEGILELTVVLCIAVGLECGSHLARVVVFRSLVQNRWRSEKANEAF
jgi:hypothetical protein